MMGLKSKECGRNSRLGISRALSWDLSGMFSFGYLPQAHTYGLGAPFEGGAKTMEPGFGPSSTHIRYTGNVYV